MLETACLILRSIRKNGGLRKSLGGFDYEEKSIGSSIGSDNDSSISGRLRQQAGGDYSGSGSHRGTEGRDGRDQGRCPG